MESCSFFLGNPRPKLATCMWRVRACILPMDRDLRPALVAKCLVIIVGLSSVPPFSHHLAGLRRFCEAGFDKPMKAQEGHHLVGSLRLGGSAIATRSFSRLPRFRKLDAVHSSEAADPSHWYPIVVRLWRAGLREYRIPILLCLAFNKISGLFAGRGHGLQSDSVSLDQSHGECLSYGRSHLPPPTSKVASIPVMKHVDNAPRRRGIPHDLRYWCPGSQCNSTSFVRRSLQYFAARMLHRCTDLASLKQLAESLHLPSHYLHITPCSQLLASVTPSGDASLVWAGVRMKEDERLQSNTKHHDPDPQDSIRSRHSDENPLHGSGGR